MHESMRSRIFEPFFTNKLFGGGLGMAAAYGIVHNRGGMITVHSASLSYSLILK
jgi:C4-dicarboxylate-specific signal transduction histidine kinase